jgi:hypothetical protein
MDQELITITGQRFDGTYGERTGGQGRAGTAGGEKETILLTW